MFFYIIGILFFLTLLWMLLPDRHRISIKFKRVISFKEVTFINEKPLLPPAHSENEINSFVERRKKRILSNYSKEEMEYEIISPKGVNHNNVKRVLILLHGLRDRKEDWINKANLIDNYIELKKAGKIGDIVFILPDSGYNGESFYTNFYHLQDFRYEDYFSRELLPKLKEVYPEANFGIAGFSMGGYGAYKLGLKNTETFSVIGSISGAVSLVRLTLNRRALRFFRYAYIPRCFFKKFDQRHFMRVFGSKGSYIVKEDPYSMLKLTDKEKLKKIKFYASVGEEDKETYLMVHQWLDIVGRMKKMGLDFKAFAYKDGVHTWEYVSGDLKIFLPYFYENAVRREDEVKNRRSSRCRRKR